MLRPLLFPIVTCTAILAAACGFDHSDIASEQPVLFARPGGTTPRDSTQNLYDEAGLPLVVTFNREFFADELTHVQVIPRPPGMGPIQNPGANPRQLLIEDVVFHPRSSAYRLVLDGPAMPSPQVFSYYSGEHKVTEGAMHGHIFYPRRGREPEDALVYALLPPWNEDQVELGGDEERLFGGAIMGVTKSIIVSTEEGGWFRLAGLELGVAYVVVAIIDSSRDGRYDPLDDWWGFYRDPADALIEVVAGVSFGHLFTPPLPPLWDQTDFNLLAPGSLPSPWSQ
jgi:hypothetical protein